MSEAKAKTRLSDYASCAGCAAKMPPIGITKLLEYIPKTNDPNLLVGTETHDDAGVYRLTPELALVQTVDFFPPVVDDPYLYGQIAAANALSDVYAMGGRPITALNLVCYPDNELDTTWLAAILAGGAERCRAAGCVIVGGHTVRDTEIKFGMAVTGTIHPDHILTNATAKPGDILFLTKPLGTGYVTTAAKKQVCPPDLLQSVYDSMICLNDAANMAARVASASSMTDVTGFGLAGHALEMAEGSQVTLQIHLSKLPLFAGIEKLDLPQFRTRAVKTNREYSESHTRFELATDAHSTLREFLYDPQTSGGLLISVPADHQGKLKAELKDRGVFHAMIGEVLPREDVGLVIRE